MFDLLGRKENDLTYSLGWALARVPRLADRLVGDAVVERDEFAAPEETALSVRDTAPGATDHDDPHPADAG